MIIWRNHAKMIAKKVSVVSTIVWVQWASSEPMLAATWANESGHEGVRP